MPKHQRGIPGPKMVKDKINPHQHSMNPDRSKGKVMLQITSISALGTIETLTHFNVEIHEKVPFSLPHSLTSPPPSPSRKR